MRRVFIKLVFQHGGGAAQREHARPLGQEKVDGEGPNAGGYASQAKRLGPRRWAWVLKQAVLRPVGGIADARKIDADEYRVVVGGTEGRGDVGGFAGLVVFQQARLGRVDVPLLHVDKAHQIGRNHGVVERAGEALEYVRRAGGRGGRHQSGGPQHVDGVFLVVGVVVAGAHYPRGPGRNHLVVDEAHQDLGLGLAARVGAALAVVLVGLGPAAAALALEMVDDEAQRIGALPAPGDKNLGQRRPLKYARYVEYQGRAHWLHHGRLVDNGAVDEVGVVGLLHGVAVVHENIRVGAHHLVQPIHQVLNGRGGAGAVVLNLGEAHHIGVHLLEGADDFGALAFKIGRRFGPAGGGKAAARSVAIEVIEHVETGQL